ncbi:site-specific integrase [uncultured Enterococcus sp.]|uniref:tyrosine-type recombinase/integrase n=1 Tax=uncultured Enterococcus sp. TaxID=167972 RepID=UPI002AA81249|nr:site-specific integrase [uncultured Enterococcus sp.]
MARRGENIYKRKDGRWEGRYIKSRDKKGKIVFGYVYAKKYADLRKKLSLKKAEYASGFDEQNLYKGTVSEWMDYWLDYLMAKKIKASTYANYRGRLKKHINPYFEETLLKNLTTMKVEEFVHHLISLGLSAKTTHCIINILKSGIRKAVTEGFLGKDPCMGVILPRLKKTSVSALTKIEQERLERAAWREAECSPVILSLYTGMRIGEISALRWQDIDFSANIISVEHTLQRIMVSEDGEKRTKVIISQPKTGTSQRAIPLAKNLKSYLLEKRKLSTSEFVISCGTSYAEPRLINYRFKKLLKTAKVESVNFHALRHTFATRCVEEGVDITTLSKLLGHTSIKLTLDTYTDSMWENRQKAVSLLDRRIKKTSAA